MIENNDLFQSFELKSQKNISEYFKNHINKIILKENEINKEMS